MGIQSVEQLIPNRVNCWALLTRIETNYEVSLKFWLDLRHLPGYEVETILYVTGSGHAFDYLPDNARPYSARILDAQGGDIYQALWSALRRLESDLNKHAAERFLNARP